MLIAIITVVLSIKWKKKNIYAIIIDCHHILAIIRLNIAKIILDPTYVAPVEPRKLVARVNKRNRPAKITGKALRLKIEK